MDKLKILVRFVRAAQTESLIIFRALRSKAKKSKIFVRLTKIRARNHEAHEISIYPFYVQSICNTFLVCYVFILSVSRFNPVYAVVGNVRALRAQTSIFCDFPNVLGQNAT